MLELRIKLLLMMKTIVEMLQLRLLETKIDV